MKKLTAMLLLLVALTGCQAQQKQSTELAQPKEFLEKTQTDEGQVIDVRTPGEYKSGHIKGAKNLHIYDKDFEKQLNTLDKNVPVYVYCKAGGRSAEAVEIMEQKGFKKIIELDGGMDAWNEAGLPVE
jgi:rhodanese-related sulfurtransferase